jgi:hypothetical protein
MKLASPGGKNRDRRPRGHHRGHHRSRCASCVRLHRGRCASRVRPHRGRCASRVRPHRSRCARVRPHRSRCASRVRPTEPEGESPSHTERFAMDETRCGFHPGTLRHETRIGPSSPPLPGTLRQLKLASPCGKSRDRRRRAIIAAAAPRVSVLHTRRSEGDGSPSHTPAREAPAREHLWESPGTVAAGAARRLGVPREHLWAPSHLWVASALPPVIGRRGSRSESLSSHVTSTASSCRIAGSRLGT